MKIRGHLSASLVVNKFIQRLISRGMESVKEIWYLIFSDVETITLILSKYSAQRPITYVNTSFKLRILNTVTL